MSGYKEGSLSLTGAVSMGTGVMIGAGIFALTGEVASFAGNLLMWAFVAAGFVAGLTSYSGWNIRYYCRNIPFNRSSSSTFIPCIENG